MLSDAPGSIDGIRVATYDAGQEYDLSTSAGARDLALAFVGAGLAEEVGESKRNAAEASASEVGAASETAAAPTLKPGRKPKAQ